jgi:hypothetical protein
MRGHARPVLPVLVLAFLALGTLVAFRVPFLDMPLERDEGELAYVGWRMRVDPGFVPYRDAFLQKAPGAMLVTAAIQSTLGESVEALRGGLAAWMALTALAVGLLARRAAGALAGGLAGAAFAAASASPDLLGPTANTEMFLLLPMVASLLALPRPGEAGAPAAWAVAGALGAAAVGFKQVAVAHGALLAAWAVAAARAVPGGLARGLARTVLPLAAGASLPALALVAWFALRGSLGAFFDAVVRHNLVYASALTLPQGLENLTRELAVQAPTFAPLWALAAAALAGAGLARPWRLALGGWLLASFAAVSAGFYYRGHYFQLWLPALCVLAGAAGAALARRAAPARAGAAAVALALALFVAPPAWRHRALLGASTPAARSRALYGMNPFPESLDVAEQIRAASVPGDRVFVLGSEPQILFHAHRASATRYVITYPLMGGAPGSALRQREALDELDRARPRHVLIVRIPTSHLRHRDAPPLLFRGVVQRVARDYEVQALWVAEGEGYRRLDGEAARAHGDAGPARQGEGAALALYRRRDAAPEEPRGG